MDLKKCYIQIKIDKVKSKYKTNSFLLKIKYKIGNSYISDQIYEI